jgi:hypothetical protein
LEVPAGFYTRTGGENKDGMNKSSAQVTPAVRQGTAMPAAIIAEALLHCL